VPSPVRTVIDELLPVMQRGDLAGFQGLDNRLATDGPRMPRGDYRWACGRTYEHMIPSLTLDHVMSADEVSAWRAHIAPARETDLCGTASPG
jgi:hypothetical protein